MNSSPLRLLVVSLEIKDVLKQVNVFFLIKQSASLLLFEVDVIQWRDVRVNFWMISWRFFSAMSPVSTTTKQSFNGDALAMTLKFLSMVQIVKTSNFSKMGVVTCVVAKQHAYECG
jgi:hypothetical protein